VSASLLVAVCKKSSGQRPFSEHEPESV